MKATTQDAYQLLRQGSLALAQMEANGIKIDEDYLKRAIYVVDQRINTLEGKLKQDPIYQTWCERYDRPNLGSRTQLGEVLFNVLKYPCRTRTATDRPKVDDEVLRGLNLPFLRKYAQWQHFNKMQSTYLKGIRRETVKGFLHPMFGLNIARSYRSNAEMINVHNVPTRDPVFSKLIRRSFVARGPDYQLAEFDYKQLEVRIAACLHKDPVMLKYIEDDYDMHTDLAAQLYLLTPEQVEQCPRARYCAKNQFVFPAFYGSYFMQMAPPLWESIDKHKLEVDGISLKEHLKSKGIKRLGSTESNYTTGRIATKKGTFLEHVRLIEEDFWGNRFKVYNQWKKDWYNAYLERGWFDLVTGFRVENLHAKNDVLNYPVQGPAFHCLLWSLIQIQRWLNKQRMKTKLINEVHDSLWADIYVPEREDFIGKVKEVMTVDVRKHWEWIVVPLAVEIQLAPPGRSLWEKEKLAA